MEQKKPTPAGAVPSFMRVINARFPSKCPDSGRQIWRGDVVYYDPRGRKAYHPAADIVRIFESKREAQAVANYIDAQERAQFERY
jgi:hypothetical protein